MRSEERLNSAIPASRGSTLTLTARAVGSDGTPVGRADVAGVRLDVFEVSDEADTPVDRTAAPIRTDANHRPLAPFDTPDVDRVVLESPRTDDPGGHNVEYPLALSADFSAWYVVRLTLTMAAGDPLEFDWLIDVT